MGYTPIRINTIRPDKALSFDLFIFYQERYLKYFDTGKAIPTDLFGKLKRQKIARFYITDSDETKYQKFVDEILDGLADRQDMSVAEKAAVASDSACTAVDRMKKDPTSQVAFKMTENAAKSLRAVINKNPTALKEIFGKKASEDDAVVKHCLNVSALATKLAQKEKCTDKEIDDIAIAGLLHDLGVSRFADDKKPLFFKNRKEFTVDELRFYTNHPQSIVGLLQDKPYINKDILNLILNYSENMAGEGNNKKLKPSKLEEILSLVNCYDKRMISMKLPPTEAIKDILMKEIGKYDLNLINKLKALLQEEGVLDIKDLQE